MRSFPQPHRQEGPALTDADLAALLAGTDGAAPGLGPVADILAALTAEATSAELAAEDRALAEFRRWAGTPETQTIRVRTTALTSRLRTKVAAAAAGVAVVLAGAATAAFANVLPAPIQRFAHETIGAPLPAVQQGAPNPGQPAVPAVPKSPGRPSAQGAPRTGKHPSPHATAPGNPRGKGRAGHPHTHGKHGNPHGSGQQGNGRGHGNGQGHSNGQRHHGHGKTTNGHRQHGSPHATVHRAASRPGLRKPGTT